MIDRVKEEAEERRGLIKLLKAIFKDIGENDLPGLAQQAAYSMLFSLPALILLIVMVAAMAEQVFDVPVSEELYQAIEDYAPENAQDLLNDLVDNAIAQVSGSAAGIGIIVAVAIALYAASNSTATMLKGFDRVYNVTTKRNFAIGKLVAIAMTFALGIVLNLGIVLFAFGEQIGSWIADLLNSDTFENVFAIARQPAAVVFMVGILALFYWLGPNLRLPFRRTLPGAISATVLFGILTFGFGLYLRFAAPGSAYGALGSMLVFLLFLYFAALVILVGAQINAVLHYFYWSTPVIETEPVEPIPAPVAAPSAVAAANVGPAGWRQTAAFGVLTAALVAVLALLGRREGVG
jgi:membrane protein